MIYVIVESGSTKAEWRVCESGQVLQKFRTEGLNPSVLSLDLLFQKLHDIQAHHLNTSTPDAFYFYGAGLGRPQAIKNMDAALRQTWPSTQVEVAHDLLAAVRACNRPTGIVCILGTGSNACRYKGDEIVERIGGWGYLFGDEGGGVDLGRQWIRDMLKGRFSKETQDAFTSATGKSIQEWQMQALQAPEPAPFLASLAPTILSLADDPEVSHMITERFEAFFQETVCRMEGFKNETVDLIGSVGYHFFPFVERVANRLGVKVGKCLPDPIEGLVEYHAG